MRETRLDMSEAAIKELAQRLASHLREEMGDRLIPLQRAFDASRGGNENGLVENRDATTDLPSE
jgi:hypothetical protein